MYSIDMDIVRAVALSSVGKIVADVDAHSLDEVADHKHSALVLHSVIRQSNRRLLSYCSSL